jgi:hypothetical protein
MKENATIPYPEVGICSFTLPPRTSESGKSVYEKILIWRYKLWIQSYALEIFNVYPPKKEKAGKNKKKPFSAKSFEPATMFSGLFHRLFIGSDGLAELKNLVKKNNFYDKNNLDRVIEL